MDSSIYFNSANFENSQILNFITDKPNYDKPNYDSPIAWKYFSSEAKDTSAVGLSFPKRIWTAISGAIGTLVRTICDIFMRTICVFNFKSNLPIGDRCRWLFFCLGRDLGKLGGYIALPFTDRGFHWIQHNEFQRELLFQPTSGEVVAHTLRKLARVVASSALTNLADFCREKGKMDALLKVIILQQILHEFTDISFLTKDFDAEYWMQVERFSSLVEFLIMNRPSVKAVNKVITALENKEKYWEELYLLLEMKHYDREKYQDLHGVSSFLETIRKNFFKESNFNLEDYRLRELICKILPEKEREWNLYRICFELIEEKKEYPFILCLLEKISAKDQKNLINNVSLEPFLEARVGDRKIESKVTRIIFNIKHYISEELRTKVTASILNIYFEGVEKAIELLSHKDLSEGFDKKQILKKAFDLLLKLDTARTINKSLPIENHKNLIVNLLKGVQEADKSLIFEVFVEAVYFTSSEHVFVGCLKEDPELLLSLFDFLRNAINSDDGGRYSRLLSRCLTAIKKVDEKTFNENIKQEIPGIVWNLLKKKTTNNKEYTSFNVARIARNITNLLPDEDDNKIELLKVFN